MEKAKEARSGFSARVLGEELGYELGRAAGRAGPGAAWNAAPRTFVAFVEPSENYARSFF